MKIKALLMGSAAAMVVATGAQAADAIVVEPEPVEYVRICDAYGSGFFYIPGTETCIAFSGFVRSSYEKVHIDGDINVTSTSTTTAQVAGTTSQGGSGTITITNTNTNSFLAPQERSFTFWGQRARLNVDVRNETDWGTLRSQLRLEAGSSNVDADYDMDRALISIAGFRFGFTDNYWSTNHGYAWFNAEGLGNTAGGNYIGDLWYGFDDATIADYTWAADGLAITVGAEDNRIVYGRGGYGNSTNSGAQDGRANFYAGFNWSAGIATLAGSAYFDSNATEYTTTTNAVIGAGGASGDNDGGWAYKVSLGLDLSEWIPGGSLWGMYMADGDEDTSYVQDYITLANPEAIWMATYQMDLTDEVQFLAGYAHSEGTSYSNPTIQSIRGEGDASQWMVGLNWYPAAAPGFHIKAAYFAGEVDNSRGLFSAASSAANGGRVGTGQAVSYDFDGWTVSLRRDW